VLHAIELPELTYYWSCFYEQQKKSDRPPLTAVNLHLCYSQWIYTRRKSGNSQKGPIQLVTQRTVIKMPAC